MIFFCLDSIVGFFFKTLLCDKVIIICFLCFQCCDEVAEKYPEIEYEKVVIDNCCMMVSYIQHVLSLPFVLNCT